MMNNRLKACTNGESLRSQITGDRSILPHQLNKYITSRMDVHLRDLLVLVTDPSSCFTSRT